MEISIETVLEQLIAHIEKKEYKGYDPYDAMNLVLPWKILGRKIPVIFIQFFKRLPVNLRPYLGMKPGYNPKAMGLFLHAFVILFRKTGKEEFLKRAQFLFGWLCENASRDYKGSSWGYDFQWISPIRNLPAFAPSAVVTAFICRGVYAYYQATNDPKAKHILLTAAEFISSELPKVEDNTGICFSYTPMQEEICYNASLLAAEVLYYANTFLEDESLSNQIVAAVNFVLSRQKPDGSWYYSQSLDMRTERRQIDFHQGFILESLHILRECPGMDRRQCNNAIRGGLAFYRFQQFHDNGQAKYRLPKSYPVDIHHVAQGVLTFTRLSEYDPSYLIFSRQIASWAILHMFASKHYFYYRKYKYFRNRIDYMRWGQAWMLLALAEII